MGPSGSSHTTHTHLGHVDHVFRTQTLPKHLLGLVDTEPTQTRTSAFSFPSGHPLYECTQTIPHPLTTVKRFVVLLRNSVCVCVRHSVKNPFPVLGATVTKRSNGPIYRMFQYWISGFLHFPCSFELTDCRYNYVLKKMDS